MGEALMHALGVEIAAPERLPGLLPGAGPVPGRRATFTPCDEQAVEAAWPGAGAERLVDRRHPDGRLFMAVDRHPEAGVRIEAPGYGRHVIGPDGRSWVGTLPPGPAWHWQKFVFAQVLPTIAVLHGLDIFHAGAVALAGRAYGLIAASGTGKSSLAAHLVACGARFVTDDVLTVEAAEDGLAAHPGPQFANLYGHELEAVASSARGRLGVETGQSDKRHFAPHGLEHPVPLGGMLFLRRVESGPPLELERVAADPRLLLGSAFAGHLDQPRRLRARIEICAAIAESVPLVRVSMGPGSSAAAAAASLWGRLEAEVLV